MSLLIIVILVAALSFDYINGFHDTANAIATVVSTRVLTPMAAILMAASFNVAGALYSTNVAGTIAKEIVDKDRATETIVLAAVIGAIVWNLITWIYGIPSSSSHALIGGLIGAAMAKAGTSLIHWHGVLIKVVYPLIGSPIAGFIVAYLLMSLIAFFFSRVNAGKAGGVFRKLQLLSSAYMAYSHGQNDAQKSMGIITLALFAGHVIPTATVPLWVKIACACAMGLGTAAGGWRIIKTLGHKIIRLGPVHGFAAETAGATVIMTAGHFGMPISTTHAITASVFGVGASKRLSAVRWHVARNILVAWVVTIPAGAAMGAGFYFLVSQIWR